MADPDSVAFGEFVLEPTQQRVLRGDGTPLDLTPRLFSTLVFFVEHPGELLDKDTLIQAIWSGLVVEENNLSQVVSGLRRALGDEPQGSRYIQTVPRRGFRFVAEVSRPAVTLPAPVPADGVDETATPGAISAAQPEPAQPRRAWLQSALGLGLLAGVGGATWAFWSPAKPGEEAAAPTLAVLPFKPLAAEGRDELLELGMADSVAAQLSTLPGLVVRSTSSVRRYAGADQDPMRAARELDVNWIVDGSVQRRGEQLRITTRLLRAPDGAAAWSGNFDLRYTSVFDIQDQIANKVRAAIAPSLQAPSGSMTPLTEVGGTRSVDAYQLYLAAHWRAQGGRREDIETALGLLHQALAIDPAYALAWTELAWVHRRRLWNADGAPAEVFEAANTALKRSLALVPDLPHARSGLAFSRFWYDFDWRDAETEFHAALTANPNLVSGHWGLAQMLLTQGRIEEGLGHMRLARELDPMSPVMNTLEASFLRDLGDVDQARRRLNRALDIAPNQWLTQVALGFQLQAERQPEHALIALRRAVVLAEGGSRASAVLAVFLAGTGRGDHAEEARAMRDQLVAHSRERFVPPTSIAAVHAALGEVAPALTALERALAVRDTRLVYLNSDPYWTVLRREPRFHALLRTLKLDRLRPGLTSV
jgi:DNA-binding winged helix-turn-helix (wHTH) protein/TolB-like protein/Tfp pilus assembly protein PilF